MLDFLKEFGVSLWAAFSTLPLYARLIVGAAIGALITGLLPVIQRGTETKAPIFIECETIHWDQISPPTPPQEIVTIYTIDTWVDHSDKIISYSKLAGPAGGMSAYQTESGTSLNIFRCVVKSYADKPIFDLKIDMMTSVYKAIRQEGRTSNGELLKDLAIQVKIDRLESNELFTFYIGMQNTDAFTFAKPPEKFSYRTLVSKTRLSGVVISPERQYPSPISPKP